MAYNEQKKAQIKSFKSETRIICIRIPFVQYRKFKICIKFSFGKLETWALRCKKAQRVQQCVAIVCYFVLRKGGKRSSLNQVLPGSAVCYPDELVSPKYSVFIVSMSFTSLFSIQDGALWVCQVSKVLPKSLVFYVRPFFSDGSGSLILYFYRPLITDLL